MGKTLADKIWDAHLLPKGARDEGARDAEGAGDASNLNTDEGAGDAEGAGCAVSTDNNDTDERASASGGEGGASLATTSSAHILIDRIFLHERTGAIALESLTKRGAKVHSPAHVFCTMDHIVDTQPLPSHTSKAAVFTRDRARMPGGERFIASLRKSAHAHGLNLFDIDAPAQGIVHVTSPEQGIVLPGLTLVCPDSHTCTQGAFGALAWGIGSSEAEHALITQTLRVSKPRNMRVELTRTPSRHITAKDIMLALISAYGADGAQGYIIEFTGSGVAAMDMESRMTLCNMAVEFGAFSAIIAPDSRTFEWLESRSFTPQGAAWAAACRDWRDLKSDSDAQYDKALTLDIGALVPMVSWGTSPAHSVRLDASVPVLDDASFKRAADYMGLAAGDSLAGLKIDGAFIGSCTNGRLSDLRAAAAILRGKRIAEGVRAICAPGSRAVKRAAEAEGIDIIFKQAGFEWHSAGCAFCFYAGGDTFAPLARIITATNRNFEGRQGPQVRSHLASPATVAASALAGHIARPNQM